MLQKIKDVAMTIGTNVKQAVITGISTVKNWFSPTAIEGEYLGKGGVSLSRRSFFTRGSMFVAATACLVMLPSLAMAAVPADVTTAITTGATDVATLGSAILTVIVAIVGFNWLRRVIK